MNISDTILDEIITDLKSIPETSILDGYLVHYADDLMAAGGENNFPCVAVQLKTEDPVSDNGRKIKLNRTYTMIGAIDALDVTLVNKRLNALLLSVRLALYEDTYAKNDSSAQKIEIGTVNFKLPENSDIYALFECDLTVTYVQKL